MAGKCGGIIANNLFRVNELSLNEKGFLGFMISLDNRFSGEKNNGFFFSRKQFQQELGISSLATISNYTHKLERLHFIYIIEIGKKLDNKYVINWPFINRIAQTKLEIGETLSSQKIYEEMLIEEKEIALSASCFTTAKKIENEAVEAPKKVETSNPTPATIEAQECRKECEIAISERTLESHPEEDEEIIDIMFNIVDKENPGGLVEEYCQGHQENAELMRHYFKLYMREKSERENAMYSTKKDIPAKVEETPAATEDTVEMPADLSRKVKTQLQPYLKNIPEPILNKVMDSMYKAKVGKMKREKWQLTMLPALLIQGVEGKIWIQQLWNNF